MTVRKNRRKNLPKIASETIGLNGRSASFGDDDSADWYLWQLTQALLEIAKSTVEKGGTISNDSE